MTPRTSHLGLALLLLATLAAPCMGEAPRGLKVSENKRFLVQEDGTPFFYLGDTAWELFHRLDREEAERYLKNRAEKGFTVIQAVVLAELNGLRDPNPYGHRPLEDDDPTRPVEKYFEHVDWIVQKANEKGLTIGMLPTWGNNWNSGEGKTGIFTPENAQAYGEWLGRRYQDAALIWIVGGDRNVENDQQRAIVEAMARGLRMGDDGAHLITFHPRGGQTSATWFHNADWLDFNMNQNGHGIEFERFVRTREVYDRSPTKPIIDGEPIYEDHPIAFNAKQNGHSIAADVRRPLYWNLFQGAFGHTYGHHSVWQMWQPGRNPVNGPLMPWLEAIDQPGARQMQHGRRLIESRPFLSRVPDDSVIVPADVPTSVPGAGLKRYVATRDAEGRYLMVYAPVGRPFTVRLDALSGDTAKGWWFNPRTGEATLFDEFPSADTRTFTPPDPGEQLDWILVLDDAEQDFSPPGQPRVITP